MTTFGERLMGLSVRQFHGQLLVSGHDELGTGFTTTISGLLVLGEDLERFLNPIIEGIRLKRTSTARSNLRHLSTLGEAMSALHVTSLPVSEFGWQELIRSIHYFIITRPGSTATLKTRISCVWLAIRGFLNNLVEAGVIPVSVYMPPVREALECLDISSYQEMLIGQKSSTKVKATEKIEKLLCSVSLARTDAEYLDEIRDTLAARRHLLFETLVGYWRQIKANFEFGRMLRESVVWCDLKPLVENYPLGGPKNHPANPAISIRGLANYLSVIQNEYDGCPPSDDDLRKFKRNFECLPRLSNIPSISTWAINHDAPGAPYGRQGWSERNVLWWWQGRISHFDVSIVSALLIMLHPSWTPSSIMLARVENRRGKLYLDLSDKGHVYEVEKPRAKEMKAEALTPLAFEIINTLVREGEELRQTLRDNGDPKSSLLFLPYGKTKVAAPLPSGAAAFLSGSVAARSDLCHVWIGSINPELVSGGLDIGTISFAKIRNTEGVLEWFRTKSLKSVARKLGNSEKVVLQHYIPKPILDAWNTRMIRRFQNLWISVAAANEQFLLEVTDFSSLMDLHAFLKDILQLHAPTDSPLAEMLHQRFDIQVNVESSEIKKVDCDNALLHVAISRSTLSALYSYQATVLHLGLSDAVLDKPDLLTGLSPRQFITLTDLLQSQLPKDKNPEYVACHEEALRVSAELSNRITWRQLFIV
ncbi:hypothetical protein [Chitinimonas naiadis]